MLSLWKLRVGQENYYLGQVAGGLDDYYAGSGETPGRWVGAAVSALGMAGAVGARDLQAVLAGLRPGTGLTPNGETLRTWRNRVPGFDLTFAAPKSVSVLYALADPLVRANVVEATDAAVDAAVTWLEREACWVRRGSNNRASGGADRDGFGTRRLPGAGFVGAAFRHRTSRAGDPHLHTHVLVANITCGPDGRWSALDGQGLYRSKLAAGVVYQMVLRDQLSRRLGVEWGPIRNDVADLAGIPAEVVRMFSKRRVEIEAELERRGTTGAEAAREAMLTTRTPKVEIDGDALTARWCDEAATVGFGPDDIDRLLAEPVAEVSKATLELEDPGTGALVEHDVDVEMFAAQLAEQLVGVDSTFTRHEVMTAAASKLARGTSVAGLQRVADWVLAQPELVPVPKADGGDAGWEQRWTSRRLLGIEEELVEYFAPVVRGVGQVDAATVTAVMSSCALGADQAATVHKVTTNGLGVEVIVGRAGSGKTYTMDAVRAVYERAGYRLIGVAPSARAARELADGAGIDAYTIPRFMRHAAPQLGAADVVILDEAGMAGTVDLHTIITSACQVGAKVILVGDHHQLPEVAAGGGFAAAVAATGGRAGELTINRRQRAEWECEALDELRNGHVATAFAAYLDHGRVVLSGDGDEVHTAAVTDWLAAHRGGEMAMLLAGTRSEARVLNEAARAAVADDLTGPVLEVRGRPFQVGDRIVLLRNDANQHDLDHHRRCRVDNGMIATIRAVDVDNDTLDVELINGRRLALGRDYVLDGHIDHGYATTIHKAQGVTCDQTFVVGPAGLYRQAGYVAMSRPRHGASIYATSRQAAALIERPHSRGIPLPDEHDDDPGWDLRAALQTSRAKTFASSQQPHLAQVADLAGDTTLDELGARARHIHHTIRRLTTGGYTNPDGPARRLHLSRDHRRYLRPGGRVKALDWDNIGTVAVVFNDTGTALVDFVSSDGHRTRTKTLDWAELQPVDNPEPVEDLDDADGYFALAQAAVDETRTEWNEQLADHHIGVDECGIVDAAIVQRRRQLAHRLAAEQPGWLVWWLGARPLAHAGAVVYDNEVAQLAAWRDQHHIGAEVAGYGPEPDDPDGAVQWREHLDRSLATRTWLHTYRPQLDEQPAVQLSAAEIRQRLSELDAIMATAPPDQQRIVAAITAGDVTPGDVHQAVADAAATQNERRNWILEHWPHVIEHTELGRLDRDLDPLAHWPIPLDDDAQRLYDDIAAVSIDTPVERSLAELDRQLDALNPHHAIAELGRQLDEIAEQRRQLSAARTTASAHQAQMLDIHLAQLANRARQLETAQRSHSTALALWNMGSRPTELTHTINRRANHLAHLAISNRAPWVIDTIRTCAQHHRGAAHPPGVHRLITEIAAYRERVGHTGDDPLGPIPSDPSHHHRWRQLDRLTQPETRRISDMLTR